MSVKHFKYFSNALYKLLSQIEEETTEEVIKQYQTDIIAVRFDVFNNSLYLIIAAERLIKSISVLEKESIINNNNNALEKQKLLKRINALEKEKLKLMEENRMLSYRLHMKENNNNNKVGTQLKIDGKHICELKKLGYTEEKIAQQFGISRSTVWRKAKAYRESVK